MIDLLQLCAFNAAYAHAIDTDALEEWPQFFTADCLYRITHVENELEGLTAGIVYADSRAMLDERVCALRQAGDREPRRLRHLLGIPLIHTASNDGAEASTPFMVARITATGESTLFATGEYKDRFVLEAGRLLLAERVTVCDSIVTDTLMALPL